MIWSICGVKKFSLGQALFKSRKSIQTLIVTFFLVIGVIPKFCHHHVIRPLTSMLSLNPSTLSGNPCLFVNSTWKYSAPHFPCEQWAVPCSHRLHPIFHKWCHRLWPLVHKCFLSKPLCHKRQKVVPWVKWEKERFLKASRSWASCPLLSLTLWVSWARDPHHRILEATSSTNLSTIPIHWAL